MKIGIELGGSKIEIIVLEYTARKMPRRRVPTPAGDYDATLFVVAEFVTDAGRELGERRRRHAGRVAPVHRNFRR